MVIAAKLRHVFAHGHAPRSPSRVARQVHVAKAKKDDAARKALQDMFKGKDDVLSQNEQTEEGGGRGGDDDGGKDSGGGGGFGGFNWRDWWNGFSEWIDPYLRFLSAFIVLSFFPVVVDLATGGWKIIPQILRLDGSSRQTERLQRSRVVWPLCVYVQSTQAVHATGKFELPITQGTHIKDSNAYYSEDPEGKLGQEERDIIEKYGSGTDDLQ